MKSRILTLAVLIPDNAKESFKCIYIKKMHQVTEVMISKEVRRNSFLAPPVDCFTLKLEISWIISEGGKS